MAGPGKLKIWDHYERCSKKVYVNTYYVEEQLTHSTNVKWMSLWCLQQFLFIIIVNNLENNYLNIKISYYIVMAI